MRYNANLLTPMFSSPFWWSLLVNNPTKLLKKNTQCYLKNNKTPPLIPTIISHKAIPPTWMSQEASTAWDQWGISPTYKWDILHWGCFTPMILTFYVKNPTSVDIEVTPRYPDCSRFEGRSTNAERHWEIAKHPAVIHRWGPLLTNRNEPNGSCELRRKKHAPKNTQDRKDFWRNDLEGYQLFVAQSLEGRRVT